ncbi:hypothetical protein MBLNU230_g7368t1 [Neophaeotheca triangularis]
MNSKNKWETGPDTNMYYVDTRATDEKAMPSDAAARARAKSAEIMASLKKGEPGDADKLMGRDTNETGKLLPMGWWKRKLSGGKKAGEDGSKEGADVK